MTRRGIEINGCPPRTGHWPVREAVACGFCDEVHELFVQVDRDLTSPLHTAEVRTLMAIRALSWEGWYLMRGPNGSAWVCGPCARGAGDKRDEVFMAAVANQIVWTGVQVEDEQGRVAA